MLVQSLPALVLMQWVSPVLPHVENGSNKFNELEVTLQVKSYNLQATSYKLQVTSYKLKVTSYKLQVTSYKLQVTSYKLQVTSYKLKINICLPQICNEQ